MKWAVPFGGKFVRQALRLPTDEHLVAGLVGVVSVWLMGKGDVVLGHLSACCEGAEFVGQVGCWVGSRSKGMCTDVAVRRKS